MEQRHDVHASTSDAVRRAQEVVGLYGDPTATWGISVELAFDDPLSIEQMPSRAKQLVVDFPHLGRAPVIARAKDEEWERERAQMTSAPYGADGPLVRVAISTSGRRILVAAHHGVCDGLGLVAIASHLTDRAISSQARGIGERRSTRSFLTASLGRLRESLLHPHARFHGAGSSEPGRCDVLHTRQHPALRKGTVEICHALVKAFAEWPTKGRRTRSPLILIGASRRTSGPLHPDRQTAYIRFPLDVTWPVQRIRKEFAAIMPEPDFPETSAKGLGPLVVRLLRRRLGATVLLSNLGVLDGDGLDSVAMFPAASGPRAVAVGMATTGSVTTLSLRTRSQDFTQGEANELMERISRCFAAEPDRYQ